MSGENNGKVLDFGDLPANKSDTVLEQELRDVIGDEYSAEGDALVNELMRRVKARGQWLEFAGAAVVTGDRMRFSIPAYNYIGNEPDRSTVVVRVAEIQVEADGAKRVIVTPE